MWQISRPQHRKKKINVQIDTGTDWHETCSYRLLINSDYTMPVASSLLLRPTDRVEHKSSSRKINLI